MRADTRQQDRAALVLVDLDGLHDTAFSESAWGESLRKCGTSLSYRSVQVEVCANLASIEQISARITECLDGLMMGILKGFRVPATGVSIDLAVVPVVPQAADSLLLTLLKEAPDESCCGPFTEVLIAARDQELHRATQRILGTGAKATHPKFRKSQASDLLLSRYVWASARGAWTRRTAPHRGFRDDGVSRRSVPVLRIEDAVTAQSFASLPLQVDWHRSPSQSLARASAMPGLLSQISATAESVRGIGRARRNRGTLGLVDQRDQVEILQPTDGVIPRTPPEVVMPGPLGEGAVFLRWEKMTPTPAVAALSVATRLPMKWLQPALEEARQSVVPILKPSATESNEFLRGEIEVSGLLKRMRGPGRFGRLRLRTMVHSGGIIGFDYTHSTVTGNLPVPLPQAWPVDPAGKPIKPSNLQILWLAAPPAITGGKFEIEALGAQHPDGPGLVWRDPIEGPGTAKTQLPAAPYQIVQVQLPGRRALAINGTSRVPADQSVRVVAIQDLPRAERLRFSPVVRGGMTHAFCRLLNFPLLVIC